jgi:hypothetical protein
MKGLSLQDMSAYALALVVIAVILGVTATILVQVQRTQCVGGTAGWNETAGACVGAGGVVPNTSTIASNATGYGITGTGTMSQWLPIIAVIVAAAIVIGIIVSAFRG